MKLVNVEVQDVAIRGTVADSIQHYKPGRRHGIATRKQRQIRQVLSAVQCSERPAGECSDSATARS